MHALNHFPYMEMITIYSPSKLGKGDVTFIHSRASLVSLFTLHPNPTLCTLTEPCQGISDNAGCLYL